MATWEVIQFETKEDPCVSRTARFADAWALAQPYPDMDGYKWIILSRKEVKERFDAGETSVLVAWAGAKAHTIIKRLR